MRVTFLGTGTSRGIPVIGCQCDTCTSTNPHNRRMRSSVMIESDSTRVVIDTSVDFRHQMLEHDVRHLEGVVYTHSHADHILGLDDVYPFNIWSGKPLKAWAAPATLAEIKTTFRHLFAETRYPGIPQVELTPIDGPFAVGNLRFEPVEILHGCLPILGFVIGGFGYLTDVSEIPDKSLEKLTGLDVLVLDALRPRPHPTHFSIEQAAEMACRLDAGQTYLIHMSHEVEHAAVSGQLPERVALSYDGLVVEL